MAKTKLEKAAIMARGALTARGKLIDDCENCPNCFTWTSSGSRRGRCDKHQEESGEVAASEYKALAKLKEVS